VFRVMQLSLLVDIDGEQVLDLIKDVKKKEGTLIFVDKISMVFEFLSEGLIFSLFRP
jgi:hypothetical protein